jgi:hypothetical protein
MHCERCGRSVDKKPDRTPGGAKYVKVVHGYYGCDTGCCGHEIIAVGKAGFIVAEKWVFDHADDYEGHEVFACELAHRFFPGVPLKLSKCRVRGYDC